MATTFTGGLKSILNSSNVLRADIHVNDMEVDGDLQVDGDFDIKGEICINDGAVDQVCLSSTTLEKKAPAEDFEIKNSTANDLILNAANAAGDLKLQVNSIDIATASAGSFQIDSPLVVDNTDANGLLVRQDGGGATCFNVNTTGCFVDIGGSGLRFTTGGNDLINHYERYAGVDTVSGPWAVDQTFNYNAVRIGKSVTLHLPAVSAAGTLSATAMTVTDLPAQIRPKAVNHYAIIVENQGTKQFGEVIVSSSGNVQFAKDAASTAFDLGGATVGWPATSVVYDVN